MDLKHAHKSAERFHKATLVLVSNLTGLTTKHIIKNNTCFPIVVNKGDGNICCASLGQSNGDSDFITPYIVNASFSLELNLKLLIFSDTGEWPKGHNLLDLFSKFNESKQEDINQSFIEHSNNSPELKNLLQALQEKDFAIEWELKNLLEKSGKAFETWRYAFEGNHGCFAGYTQIHKALRMQIEAANS